MSNKEDKTQSEPRLEDTQTTPFSISTGKHTEALQGVKGREHGESWQGDGEIEIRSASSKHHTNLLRGKEGRQSGSDNQSNGGSGNDSSSQSDGKGSGGKS